MWFWKQTAQPVASQKQPPCCCPVGSLRGGVGPLQVGTEQKGLLAQTEPAASVQLISVYVTFQYPLQF